MPRARKQQPRLKPSPAPIPAGLPEDRVEEEEARRIGEAVRALRERRGLQQVELSALSGLTAPQVSAIERGRRPPSLRTLRRVCEALGASVDDLLRAAIGRAAAAEAEPAAGMLPGMQELFRSPEDALFAPLAARGIVRTTRADTLSAPLPSQETVEAVERRILDYRRLETLCGAFAGASVPLSLPFQLDAEGAELLADRVRKLLGLGDTIVLDYVSVFEAHGVRVLFLPLGRGIESLSFFDARTSSAFVVLSEETTPEKQLFRLALELAWLYLSARNGGAPVPEAAEANRRFAKLFAACFLLPRGAVLAAAASIGAGRGDWTYPLVLRVKRRFGTSAEAFAYRLLELGLLSDEALTGILGAIKAHYATHQNREPGEALPPLARNGRLGDLVERARTVAGAHDEVLAIARRAGMA
jgi:transcriptional regulator with XRE-family HTH domain